MEDESEPERVPWDGKERRSTDGWHLDKRIPIAIVAAILVQIVAMLWWAAELQFREQDHELRLMSLEHTREERNIALAGMTERLAKIEEDLHFLVNGWRLNLRDQPNDNRDPEPRK